MVEKLIHSKKFNEKVTQICRKKMVNVQSVSEI